MKKMVILLMIMTIFSLQDYGQEEIDLLIDPVLLNLKGQVINSEDGEPVPYASVINPRTHRGALTNAEGYFTMEVLNIDSLLISIIGYTKEYLEIPNNQNEDSVLVLKARPIRYAINEIEVTGNALDVNIDGLGSGKPVDISPELRGAAFNSKPNILNAIFQPLSFLQYHLSKSEKEKREVRAAMISQADWEKLSTVYNKDMVMNLTGLNKFQADTFMIYFNSKNILSGQSSEYDVRDAVLTQYKNYLADKKDTVQVE